jgi:hypothetical protein
MTLAASKALRRYDPERTDWLRGSESSDAHPVDQAWPMPWGPYFRSQISTLVLAVAYDSWRWVRRSLRQVIDFHEIRA